MPLTEAEIQVLASLHKAETENGPSDKASLEKGGDRYWIFQEDWTDAYQSLKEKRLIAGDEASYRLTADGRPLARGYYAERPSHYWYYYQVFWTAAEASAAHTHHCERVFGKDLCQDGMVDMAALEDMLARLNLRPGDRVLDLGCGIGSIAEYISDVTGVEVLGLDYSAPAIAVANARTTEKRSRLTFIEGDLNALDLPENSFDAAISLDTLYWVSDLPDTISQVLRAVKPGGQLAVFMLQYREEGDPAEILEAENTDLSRALKKLNLPFEVIDYTAENNAFWQRNWESARELQSAFEAEGNGFIAASLIKEAEEEFLPAAKDGSITRFFYHLRV